ncbi:MAG: hypothetical protein ACP5XB_15365, partial [Isosphaeraceae bacterium]
GPLASKLEVQELASTYRSNMLQALQREQARRKAISEEKLAEEARKPSTESDEPRQERKPRRELAEAAAPAHTRRVPPPPAPELAPNSASRARKARPGGRSGRATIDEVFSAPDQFDGETLLLDGLFRIGTKVERVRYSSGQAVGFSLPLARDDGRTLCTGDGKIVKQDMMLLIDAEVVGHLERFLTQLRVPTLSRPVYRSIVGVRMESRTENDHTARTLVINSLEILGVCNFRHVAEGNYAQAFRVLEVTSARARTKYGDGKEWIDRLGGEEKFVGTVRRKLKEMQRHFAATLREAQFDKFFQKEMAVGMKMAESQARFIQAVRDEFR